VTRTAYPRTKPSVRRAEKPVLWAAAGCLLGAALVGSITYADSALDDHRVLADAVTGHSISAAGSTRDRLTACEVAMSRAAKAMHKADAAMGRLDKGISDYFDPSGFAAGGTAALLKIQAAADDSMATARQQMTDAKASCAGADTAAALG
jgi:hypothetical protein